MKPRQLNRTPAYILGLTALLLLGCLLMAAGTTFARYRVEEEATVNLRARALEKIYLGQMVRSQEDPEHLVFSHESQGTWQTVDGETRLNFAVANGTQTAQQDQSIQEEAASDETTPQPYASIDQRILIRVYGSLGIWDGKEEFTLKLKVPEEGKALEEMTYTYLEATAQRIHPDSPEYMTFGDGWIFTFRDEDEQELSWLLAGGTFSVLELSLILEGEIPDNTGLLQLYVTGDYTVKK